MGIVGQNHALSARLLYTLCEADLHEAGHDFVGQDVDDVGHSRNQRFLFLLLGFFRRLCLRCAFAE